MRIGILGGSFNPPHLGHLALARGALDTGLIDRVLFVPAAVPPHKKTPVEADAATRLAMTRILCEEDERLDADGVELERVGPSYTVDTVRELRTARPNAAFRLIIGSDMAIMFSRWKEPRTLLRLAPPLIAERPGVPLDGIVDEPPPFGFDEEERAIMRAGRFAMEPVDISSTMVRSFLEDGAPEHILLRYLTPGVIEYIRSHGLYGYVGREA